MFKQQSMIQLCKKVTELRLNFILTFHLHRCLILIKYIFRYCSKCNVKVTLSKQKYGKLKGIYLIE